MNKINLNDNIDAQVQHYADTSDNRLGLNGVFKMNHFEVHDHLRGRYLEIRSKISELLKTFSAKAEEEIKRLEMQLLDLSECVYGEEYKNTVVTVGKDFVLDTVLAGSTYTATSYMGLISSVSYSAINSADTMASHAGWTEAGPTNAPEYTGNRKTNAWNSASAGAKALSSNHVYAMTATGTVKGSFVVIGSGASATKDNTGGTLLSAGLFSGGDRSVSNGSTLTVSYTLNS